MNVLSIPKQADHELIYSSHAIKRANERDVPMPKYLPFGTKFIEAKYVRGDFRLKLSFIYNHVKYILVLSENQSVVTVYPFEDPTEEETISSAIARLRARMNPGMIASDKFICLDYETDYYLNQQCAWFYIIYAVLYMQWRLVMYSDAEMEDVLFPHMMTVEQLDEQFDIEPDCEDPWSEAWMDANALESAGMGEDDGCSDIDW